MPPETTDASTIQTIGLIVIALGGLGLLIGLIWAGLRENRGDPLQERLAEFAESEAPKSLEELEMSLGFKDRVLLPLFKTLADRLSRFTPESQIEAVRRKIELAGQTDKMDPRTFFGMRIMLMVMLGTRRRVRLLRHASLGHADGGRLDGAASFSRLLPA
jgi:hypothetical protein